MHIDLILLLEEFLNATFPEVADGWTKVEKLSKRGYQENPSPSIFSWVQLQWMELVLYYFVQSI